MTEKLTFKNKFETTNLIKPILVLVLSAVLLFLLKGFIKNDVVNLSLYIFFIILAFVLLLRDCTGLKESAKILTNPSMLKEMVILAILILFIELAITILLSFFVSAGYLGSEFIEGNVSFGNFIIINIIGAVILAPIAEELFFRGFLFNRLNFKLSKWKYGLLASIIITSLVFAICHGVAVFLSLIPASFIFVFVYLKWDNLFASMTLHAISNFISSIFGLLALFGIFHLEKLIIGNTLLTIVFLIIGVIALYFAIKFMVDVYKKIV